MLNPPSGNFWLRVWNKLGGISNALQHVAYGVGFRASDFRGVHIAGTAKGFLLRTARHLPYSKPFALKNRSYVQLLEVHDADAESYSRNPRNLKSRPEAKPKLPIKPKHKDPKLLVSRYDGTKPSKG